MTSHKGLHVSGVRVIAIFRQTGLVMIYMRDVTYYYELEILIDKGKERIINKNTISIM